jgi:putative inorganic carbon (HCO3(-)) transporter
MTLSLRRIVRDGEIWVVGGAVVASVVSERLLLTALVIIVISWIIRWLASGRLSVRTPADWAIIGLVTTLPMTLLVTAYPEITVPQVYRLITGIALYYALANWTISVVRFRLLWGGIGLAGGVLAFFALFSVKDVQRTLGFFPSVQGFSDIVNPNVMAGQLVLVFPMILAPLVFPVQWPVRWLLRTLSGVVGAVIFGILLLTNSRGALLALAFSLLVLFLLHWRQKWLRTALLVAIVGAGLFLFGWEQLLLLVVNSESDVLEGEKGRLEIWTRAWYMLQDFPFTGMGMGSFQKVVARFYPYIIVPESRGEHAHNIFLQIGADLGLVGLVTWLSILLLTIITTWRTYHRGIEAGNNEAAAAGAGLLCSQIALVVHGMVDAVTWGMIRPAPLVWVLWGLAVASRPAFAGKTNPGSDSAASHTL